VPALPSPGEPIAFDAILFDLFHTLVDPQEHAAPGFRRLSAVAEILDLPQIDVDVWWEQVVGELVAAPLSPVDAIVELARVKRIVLSPAAIAELDRAMGGAADAALANPIAGAVEALGQLAAMGVKRGILSNALVRDVRAFPSSPLASLVDDARMSCFTGFVGDGGTDEFIGARQVGFAQVVAVTGAIDRGGWRPADQQRQILGQADRQFSGVSDLVATISS
jgi:FMN phosphatase YigB (HAD superfamily)